MSFFGKYFGGWQFRTSRPTLSVGDEVNVFLNEYDGDGAGIARIGDTRLTVEGVDPGLVEKRVSVRVTAFDDSSATGRGEYLETVGESSYTG